MELSIPLDAAGWQAQPDQVRGGELPRHLTIYPRPQQPAGEPFYVVSAEHGPAFEIQGDMPNLRTMVWTQSLPTADLSAYKYAVLTYCAFGLSRGYAPTNALAITGQDAEGKDVTVPLLPTAELLNDFLWHVTVRKVELPKSGVLRVEVGTKDSDASLALGRLELYTELPSFAALAESESPLRPNPTWRPIDLTPLYNDSLAAAFTRQLEEQGVVIDGLNALSGEAICSVPFLTGSAEANLVRPAETRGDEEPIEFLGVQTTRHYVRPPGRDDTIAVDLNHKASEALFVMISEIPKPGPQYNRPPGPHNYNDIGALSVELQYDSGEPDIAFPYSLADEGFTAFREAGVYVVPADPTRTLKRLILHNRVNGNNHSLAALTLNTGADRAIPALAYEPGPNRIPKLAAPKPQQPYLRREGQLLKVGNSACDMVIDCSEGLQVTKLTNRAAPRAPFTMRAGLEVRVGDTILGSGAFRAQSISIEGTEATIALESLVPEVHLTLDLRVAVDDQPEVRLSLTARNTGDQALTPLVRFPALTGVTIGSAEDTCRFFPQYRTILGDDFGSYVVGNDRSFPMQFMDIFNPAAGIGLGLLTRNTEMLPLQYGTGKSAAGVDAFVQSTEAFSRLRPGQTLTMPEAALLPHTGDWHAVMDRYQHWLRRVGASVPDARAPEDRRAYAPSGSVPDAQQRDWFQRLYAMRVHLTKKSYSWAIPIFDPDTNEYKIDEFMQADTDYLGLPPQIVHLGGWVDYDNEHGGDFLGGDYAVEEYTGGADTLRAAIRKLQDERQIPVSLYMIPDRCRKTSAIAQRLGRKVCTINASGWVGDDGPLYYTCCAYPAWRDHYVEAVKRTQRETGVKAIYVDVFGFSQNTACYSTEHGHPVPSNPIATNRDLIRRIREALPPDVAVWTEFPLEDTSARYNDGNIHYYALNWHEYFSEPHDRAESAPRAYPMAWNAYRFAFPTIRQFIFLCGSDSWSSECRFPFFNGEPLYDVSWFLYAGENLELIRNALALQTQYADCFSSRRPVMNVPTEKADVHANEFPGEGRTAWTLFNARYTTVTGPVLRLPHVAGATYRDAWNGKPLKPTISGKTATISLRVEPQALGCVIQERKQP